jgi:hypothetical protein
MREGSDKCGGGRERRLIVRRGSGAQLQNGYDLLQCDAVYFEIYGQTH